MKYFPNQLTEENVAKIVRVARRGGHMALGAIAFAKRDADAGDEDAKKWLAKVKKYIDEHPVPLEPLVVPQGES